MATETVTQIGEGAHMPKGNSKRSWYEVFACLDDHDDPEQAIREGVWRNVGRYQVDNNGGQRSARRQALENTENTELRDVIESGKPVFFFCMPVRSLHPFRSSMEERVPKLVI